MSKLLGELFKLAELTGDDLDAERRERAEVAAAQTAKTWEIVALQRRIQREGPLVGVFAAGQLIGDWQTWEGGKVAVPAGWVGVIDEVVFTLDGGPTLGRVPFGPIKITNPCGRKKIDVSSVRDHPY